MEILIQGEATLFYPVKFPGIKMVSSDESVSSRNNESSDEEVESPDDTQQQDVKKVRAPRTQTKWPTDKITVTGIDADGMPSEKDAKKRMRRLAGLIARQELSLTLPQFNCLSKDEKAALFDDYVQPFLEFPEDMKDLGMRHAMKTIAKCFRSYKSRLVSDFLEKGLEPFRKHKHIQPVDWAEFVKMKSSEESKSKSQYFTDLRGKNTLDHKLGPTGYDGKIPQWEAEDAMMEKEGIPNPWEQYPEGRIRWYLRARSTLIISEGWAEIKWKSDEALEVSHNIKKKHEESCQGSGVTWVRENDILSACLGPEYTGRVHGMSSYLGWKHWPKCSGMYKKRKRTGVDRDALKAELKEELRQEFLDMFLSSNREQPKFNPFSRTPSPTTGRRSSRGSAAEDDIDTQDMVDLPPSSIELLDGPTN